MNFIRTRIQNMQALAKNEDGLTTVEYAIILVLVAIIAITAWGRLGSAVNSAANKGAEAVEGLNK